VEEFSVPDSVIRGQVVSVLLTSDRTWRPMDVLPGNPDDRALSVQIQRVGFCP
jgi:hypothetical protein